MATETKPPHQNDILVESNSYETIPERQYKILQVYRSVIQSEDPDWKIQLAKDMVGSLGFSPKIANDCFILHGDDLYFKEESETAWRIVKPGTISTISQEILDADDSSLSMIVPESNKEYDINEMDIEKENDVFPVGPISFPPMFVANDDNDSVPILSPPKVNCAIMSDTTNEGMLCGGTEQMLNDTIKSLDVSCAESFDWEAPTKAMDIFTDTTSIEMAGLPPSK